MNAGDLIYEGLIKNIPTILTLIVLATVAYVKMKTKVENVSTKVDSLTIDQKGICTDMNTQLTKFGVDVDRRISTFEVKMDARVHGVEMTIEHGLSELRRMDAATFTSIEQVKDHVNKIDVANRQEEKDGAVLKFRVDTMEHALKIRGQQKGIQ